MSDWTDRLADSLGVARLDAGAQALLLQASREIAHRLERRETPLAAYLMGMSAGTEIAAGAEPSAALREAVDTVLAFLPPAQPEDGQPVIAPRE